MDRDTTAPAILTAMAKPIITPRPGGAYSTGTSINATTTATKASVMTGVKAHAMAPAGDTRDAAAIAATVETGTADTAATGTVVTGIVDTAVIAIAGTGGSVANGATV